MQRRHILAGAAAAALGARPALGQGTSGAPQVLKFVPQAAPAGLDPIVNTSAATRQHGYAVWDTLYGVNQDYLAEPQMAEGHTVEQDGKRVTIRLREGLKFHDGEVVRAADCIASIRRWAARDALGQALLTRTEELSAPDERTILFRLSRPFPPLLYALAKPSPPVCFIMPERLAATEPTRAVSEIVGSGPYRFMAGDHVAGSRIAYERFSGYVPRPMGSATWTAGPKRAHFQRVEWHVIADPARAAAALEAGEVDWWENPGIALQAGLRRESRGGHGGPRPQWLYRHRAVQPPASALRPRADPARIARRIGPARLHGGGGRDRPEPVAWRYRCFPAGHAARER